MQAIAVGYKPLRIDPVSGEMLYHKYLLYITPDGVEYARLRTH
jgi:hypothetical protein